MASSNLRIHRLSYFPSWMHHFSAKKNNMAQPQQILAVSLGLQLLGGEDSQWYKKLKESWCSCVSYNDSSQYNNWTII